MIDSLPEAVPNSTEIAQLEERLAQLENQLLQSQKLATLGELSASITHEFNNILTTVINYAKLGVRHQSEEQRNKAFEKILTASQRAAKITTSLLAYARNRDDRRESLPLKEVVNDVLVLVEKDMQKHRITLNVESSGDPHAQLNAGQIQQVLLNLLVNARQAMEPGGTITIRIRENTEDNKAELTVQDTGKGIPADQLSRIFDRFFTTKTADSQGQGGTGLGLALCRKVVEAHQGRIRVESAVGHGTRFTLRFPLVPKSDFIASSGFFDSPTDSHPDSSVEKHAS